jgi:hypothetical protein
MPNFLMRVAVGFTATPIAMYVAHQHAVAPEELAGVDDINRALRRMPDIAVSTLAFAALTAALAAIDPPPRPEGAA